MTTTVLIADDEPALTNMYERWLSEYECLVAHGGSEATEILDRRGDDIDVALLDRRMPGRSGDEVLSDIEERNVECRVAMITAVAPSDDIVSMPFDDYVTKPVSAETIRGTVEALLERAEYADVLDRYYTLAAKHAALTDERSAAGLRESEAFAELEAELREVERELTESATFDDHEEFQSLLLEATRGAT
ncbi:response regulator [Halorussus limi]|uniref:Response regulator n=1 Tax=Halorussus limi TaxID=2938695 RepID=A0A8U0HQH1_9EURY|nr:response regulator [Halorussus limi]UPV72993.1 response regulator [Halorussus limi]